MDSGFMFLERSQGKRHYEYAMEHTDAALQVLDDFMTVSGADPDAIQAARVQLRDTGEYIGAGGTWKLQGVRDDDGLARWYELHESAAGTDPHYANRVETDRLRGDRHTLETLQRLVDSTPRPGSNDAEMLQRLSDLARAEMVTVGGVHDARADLVTARETINLALSGADYADLAAAAAGVDRALKALCPHDPQGWYTAPDRDGRPLTTCNTCGVSWYESEIERDMQDLPF